MTVATRTRAKSARWRSAIDLPCGHESRAPVRAVGGHRFQCLRNDVFNLLIGNLARSAHRGSSNKPPPKCSRPLPPLADRRAGNVQFRATSVLLTPWPQLSTIRARMAMACADFGRRAIILNFCRFAATISRGFLGRPVRIPKYPASISTYATDFSLMTLAICVVLLAAASSGAPEPSVLGYLGGSGTDDCDGVAMDRDGAVYLACHSDSSDFPPLSAGQPSRRSGNMDAVVVKLAARTGSVAWMTRTGGSAWDGAGDVEVAADGSVYVLGSTRSADFPTTPDAVQRRFAGPDRDVFLLKLDRAGRIVYSTLLGGSRNDEATGLAIGSDGTVFVGGVTMSEDFPGVTKRFGSTRKPDGFVARFSPGHPDSLETILIGGTEMDHISGLAIDHSGNLFATGSTASADFPLKNASQPRFGGSIDAFLVKLRVSDWEMIFSDSARWLQNGRSVLSGARLFRRPDCLRRD